MKFFHLSDLHIGLKLMNRDLREDQEYIFDQIAQLAAREQPDAIVVAGDLYDKAIPSAEAAEVFDRFVSWCAQAASDAQTAAQLLDEKMWQCETTHIQLCRRMAAARLTVPENASLTQAGKILQQWQTAIS